MRIVINGAGIAGTTLAWWLSRSGHDVLLVERSPRLRSGGYAIDFWGIGYDVAEKMGLLPRIQQAGYQVREMRYVDADNHMRGGFPVDVFTRMTRKRYTQLRRTDLATTIYAALDDRVETIFGDSIAEIEECGNCVRVGFEQTEPREADLVIGADGLHSRVRELAFGVRENFEVPLGYHVAAFEIDGYRPRDELVAVSHAAAGRQITRLSMRDDKTLFLFVFRDEYLHGCTASSIAERKALLTDAFAGVGWEAPRILDALTTVRDFYFDRVTQIRMNDWSCGRIALIGDAAACVSLLAGEGTGLAMAEAYVLAGELLVCGGDRHKAFARWQARLLPFLEAKQRAAAKFASSFAPRTTLGVAFRDRTSRLLRVPLFANWLVGRAVRDDIQLPDYRFP
jgi:2-polyprenyl-6-methoxyphenol hydroxylase-like FAD-dependent oxidoreductase